MRAVLQRVTRASVRVAGETVGEIGPGLLVLLGVARDDEERDALYLVEKTLNLRVFEDGEGRMNLSLAERGGALLAVSQFTLYGDARRGRRPSWFDAAPPESARPLYEFFVAEARARGARVETGSFQATMEVELVNDGPVTILLDSRRLF
ncbi:MAG TPA: D-aminoacyl-tRNA deacylase [Pyrinomonadaceae bacterium]|jgi:D-tyrosyl-tRNA(Tyr) deacylase